MDEPTTPELPAHAPDDEGALRVPDDTELVPGDTELVPTIAVHFGEPPSWQPAPKVGLRARDRAVLAVILVVTAFTYLLRIGEPSRLLATGDEQCKKWPTYHSTQCWEMIPLDEVHYVPDARDVLRFGTESDTRVPTSDDGAFVVHPPAGKWFIALGIAILGDRPAGWRLFGGLSGIWGVFVMYLLALRLFRKPWLAAAAATLLAADGLWFVQSRVAMLDIYAASLTLTGIWLLIADRDRADPSARRVRWWRIGAGVAFGLALASKYPVETGLFMAVGICASVGWDLRKRSFVQIERPRALLRTAGALVLLPAVIFVATYTPWFADAHRYTPPRCEAITGLKIPGLRGATKVAKQWGCYQLEIFNFHRHLAKYEQIAAEPAPTTSPTVAPPPSGKPTETNKPAHPYFTNAWSWPWIGRPVAHYFEGVGTGDHQRDIEVLGLPNPVVWWTGFFVALPLLLWWALRRRDGRGAFLLTFLLAGWLPYVLADVVRRPVFLFYATPLVPFLVLAIVHVMSRMIWRAPRTWIACAAFVTLALASFAYFYPVLAGYPIAATDGFYGWGGHMWFSHDCGDFYANRIKIFCWI